MARTPHEKVISDARRVANQRDALRSTEPRTEEGKQRSRMNALKHGFTGAGIVALPTELAEAVEQRFLAIQEELAPTPVLGGYLAYQVALSTVRCQQAAVQKAAVLAQKIRQTPAAFDELHKAQADHFMGWIGCEPCVYRRQQMATPEGCDRLIAGIQSLIVELNQPWITWNWHHNEKLEAYLGRRETDIPRSRGIKLGRAIKGDDSELKPGELDGMTTEEGKANYACDQMTELLEAEIKRLSDHRAILDLTGLALDRTEAGARSSSTTARRRSWRGGLRRRPGATCTAPSASSTSSRRPANPPTTRSSRPCSTPRPNRCLRRARSRRLPIPKPPRLPSPADVKSFQRAIWATQWLRLNSRVRGMPPRLGPSRNLPTRSRFSA